jgi:hypothetical protein
MTASQAGWLIIVIALVSANLPWLSERVFFVRKPASGQKRAWVRWLEWLVLYFVAGAITLGMEKKLNGEIYAQDWEFYAVTLCLFLVFALPGFIYRNDLLHHLQRR